MTVYDFKLTDTGDLYIDPVSGDIVIAPSDRQHVKDILMSAPGHFKEFALVGWNPYGRLNTKGNRQEMNQSAKLQLQNDGYTVRAIDLTIDGSGTVTVNILEISR